MVFFEAEQSHTDDILQHKRTKETFYARIQCTLTLISAPKNLPVKLFATITLTILNAILLLTIKVLI